MLRQPSLQKSYPDFFSGDPAVIPAPTLEEKPTDEELARYKAEFDVYRTKIKVAKETGNWVDVTVPGQSITQFVMGHVDRNIWRSIVDRMGLNEENPRFIGPTALLGLLVRLSVQSIVGWDFKVERRADEDWGGWTMAQPELISTLDNLDARIVAELGGGIFRRLQTIHPKS